MINTVFATKQNMTQAFDGSGKRMPATVLSVPEHTPIRQTDPKKEGYLAVQLAVGRKKAGANKPLAGHLATAKLDYKPSVIREVILKETDESLVPGTKLDLSTLIGTGDSVTVSAVSKGKGFAGVVKRYGFAGGPKTHGQSDRHRAPGAIGQRTTPGRVYKGKHMPGRMGGDLVTITNLKVLSFDSTTGEITLSGPVPGARGSLVRLVVTKKGPVEETPAEQTPVEETPVAQEAPVAEVPATPEAETKATE